MKLGGIYDAHFPLQFASARDEVVFLNWDDDPMTAIAVICRPEGFIIGADGFRQTTDFSVVTRSGQKVFSFRTENFTLAYAWSGQTIVWNDRDDGRKETLFDFRAATEPALTLASLVAKDSNSLIEGFRVVFLGLLKHSDWVNVGWVGNLAKDFIARMLVVGYFNGDPFQAEITVKSCDSAPVVSVKQFLTSLNIKVFSGCPHVKADDTLAREPKDIDDARSLIHEYIQRCVDTPQCSGIGGKVHVGLVSPCSFEWIDPPELA